jgi:hypothetical protein
MKNRGRPRARRLRVRHLLTAFGVGVVVGLALYRRAQLDKSTQRFRAEYG